MRVFAVFFIFFSLAFSEVLSPKQAFVITQGGDFQGVFVRINLADKIYLYKNQLKLILNGKDLSADLNLPNTVIKDKEEVFYKALQLDLPNIMLRDLKKDSRLELFYQGCSDEGFCYRPMKAEFIINSSQKNGDLSYEIAPLKERSPSSNKLLSYLQDKNLPLILVFFFAYGLLLSLTPCTLPMFPILSSLILNQGVGKKEDKRDLNNDTSEAKSNVNLTQQEAKNSKPCSNEEAKGTKKTQMLSKKRAFFLSLVFVFFMSLAYAIAGLITASLGASVQGLLQRPLVILIFAFILVLLALSCFGLFSFSLPQNLARIKGRGFLAVALMGFLSAFIVGPCAAAPLAAALLYIAHSGDLALGGLGLFVLSFGMGVPLLALGLGLSFIKTGEWMQSVNVFFGFLLLFMAVWMMDRFLLDHLTLLLYGILGVFFVVFMGAFEQASSNLAKIKKAILILVLAYSLSLFLGGLWGGKSLLNPLNLSTQSAKQGLNFEFMDDLEKIKTSLNQKALIYFTASWCENCKLLERFTFNDEGLIESLKDFKLIKIDLSDNDSKNALIMKEFEVFAPPVLIFYDENVEFSRLVGFVSSKELLASMP